VSPRGKDYKVFFATWPRVLVSLAFFLGLAFWRDPPLPSAPASVFGHPTLSNVVIACLFSCLNMRCLSRSGRPLQQFFSPNNYRCQAHSRPPSNSARADMDLDAVPSPPPHLGIITPPHYIHSRFNFPLRVRASPVMRPMLGLRFIPQAMPWGNFSSFRDMEGVREFPMDPSFPPLMMRMLS